MFEAGRGGDVGKRAVAIVAVQPVGSGDVCHEEIGVAPKQVSVLGYLGAMATVTGYAVTPVVGCVSSDAQLALDKTEVEYAFEVPLEFLLDDRNAIPGDREYLGHKIPGVEYHYDGHRIWGATAHMILELRKITLKQ